MSAQNDSLYGEDVVRAVEDLRDYLDDVKPPLFIIGSLTLLLRTEPPVRVGTRQAAAFVCDWAEERANRSGERVSDLLLSSVRHVVDAYGMNAIESFEPKAFYRPFIQVLLDRCPDEERDGLQAALQEMQSPDPQRLQIRSTAEYSHGAAPAQKRARDGAVGEIVTRLANLKLSDADFDDAATRLHKVLVEHPAAPTPADLKRVVELGVAIFNGASVRRAARLFEILGQAIERVEGGAARQREIRAHMKSTRLEQSTLAAWIADQKRHAEIAPVVRHFADLGPSTTLAQLALEKNPARARFLSAIVQLHGRDAYSSVLAQLSSPDLSVRGVEFTAGLLGLLGHLDAPTDAERRRAAGIAGRFVIHEKPQVRAAAIASLRQVGAKEAVPHAMRALESDAYNAVPEDTDELKNHLFEAMKLLADSDMDSALAVVAEVATGARGAEFKLGRSLKELAIQVLAERQTPLPRRAALVLVAELKGVIKRRFKIITANLALGVDVPLCAALMRLLEDSPEPEARETIQHPVLLKLMARAGVK
jgi:hypothetical protein